MKQKGNVNLSLPLPLRLNILLIDNKECLCLSHFLLRQLTNNFERCLRHQEHGLFTLKVCLLSSGMFE